MSKKEQLNSKDEIKKNTKLKENDEDNIELTLEEKKERRKFIIKGIIFIFAMGWIFLILSSIAILTS